MGDPDKTINELRAAWPLDWEREGPFIWRASCGLLRLAVEHVNGFKWSTSARQRGWFVHADGGHESASAAVVALRAALPEALAVEVARLRDEAGELERVRAGLLCGTVE